MKERLIMMLLLWFGVLFLAGCGGGGSSSTTAAGTVSGTVTLPANTNAKLFGKNATVSDYTTLTVSAGGATTKPDKDGKYSLSVAAGTNIEVTVTAPSGSVVLTAIVPSVTTGVTASQDVNTTTTAVALIYKQNTSLTILQISSSAAVTDVKNAIEAALIDSDTKSVTETSSVTTAVSTAATPSLSSITLSPSSATVVSGATQTFTATGVDQFGSAISFTPTFSVSSSDLGTVSSSGVFTAAKTGTGTLTVTNGASISASATLTVTVGALNSLVISPTTVTLYKGDTQQFTVYGIDANGNTEKKKFITVSSPTWSVTGTMGSVDANGLFTASAQGTGKVQAQTTKSDGTAVSITSDVTVSNRSPSISSGPTSSSSSITTAQTATISVTATDADSDTLSYSWSATSGAISGSGASVTYTPPSSAVTDTISVTVSDGNSGSASGSVSITVTAASTATTSWLMCKGNAQHTGQAAVTGPQTGTLKWKYQFSATGGAGTGDPGSPHSIVVDKNNIMYAMANGTLFAFNTDGTVSWSKTNVGTSGGVVALSLDESTIYTSNGGGSQVLAYRISDQTLLWTNTDATDNIFGALTIASDGTIYYGSKDTYIYALSPTDGKLKWKFQTDGAIAPLAAPTLSVDEKTIYAGSGDPNSDPGGTLFAISTSDGTQKWSYDVDTTYTTRASGPVVGSDGTVYVSGHGRVFHITADGTKIWESEGATSGSLAPSLSSGGVVYAGEAGIGKVYALDASTGSTKWSFQSAKNPDYDPANPKDPPYGIVSNILIGSDGVVYFGSMGDKFYGLKSDGTELFGYSTGNNISENCPAIGPDGTLYFSAADGYIYALKD